MPSSGIGGPCDHCGRTQSCCWRRGPASKPILCNACGSRYLVKKSLDGYIPVQQRGGVVAKIPSAQKQPRGKSKTLAPTLTTTMKPKRVAPKKLDPSAWYDESFDSEESEAVAYLTDESDTPSSMAGTLLQTQGPPRSRSTLGQPTKVIHVTSTAQIKELKGLTSEDVARLFEPSLRLKPRKPVHPRISVVF